MTVDKHVVAILKERGLENEDGAQEHFDGLKDEERQEVMTLAGDNRISDKIFNRLLGNGEGGGALTDVMTQTLQKHTNDIDEQIKKIVHQRLDGAGIRPNPGSPGDKKPKDGKPKDNPIPDGFVPVSQVDELRKQINQRDIRQEISASLNGESLMPNAFDIALRELEGNAEKTEDGDVVVKMKDGDGVLRAMSPKDAVSALRGQRKFLFKASVKSGSGGGGTEEGGTGSEGPSDLPKVKSYADLLADPKLLHRYIEEAPKELEKLETAYANASGGELARILSGQGLDARSKVEAALADMKAKATKG